MIEDYSLCTYVISRFDEGTKSVRMLGTGFLISESLIVTSLHVVKSNDVGLRLIMPDITDINSYQDVENNRCTCWPLHILAADQFSDVCILKIDNMRFDVGKKCELSSMDEVKVGERVGLWGFPHCVVGRKVLTYQETELGAKIVMSTGGIKNKYGTVNIQTRPGQSGSPVFSLRTGKVVGLLVGAYAPDCGIRLGSINPYELNQTSYCISAEVIRKML